MIVKPEHISAFFIFWPVFDEEWKRSVEEEKDLTITEEAIGSKVDTITRNKFDCQVSCY